MILCKIGAVENSCPPGLLSRIEPKAGGQEFPTSPILQSITKPVVQGVRNDCFHPRGLFLLAIPEANVIARFVFGKESKMVKRMLTPDEALQVYDVSPSVDGVGLPRPNAWCCPCYKFL